MNREEAIQKIQNDLKLHHDYLSSDYRKSLRMAIEALQQPEIVRCEDCKYYRQYDDQDDLCVYTMTSVTTDDYCSYAERKEGADG